MERLNVKCIVVQMTILRMEHLGKVHTQLFRPKNFFICMRETCIQAIINLQQGNG